MGLGVAAINTGNNLLYLLVSLLLALIIVSGVLSEQSLRRLEPIAMDPEEVYAGRPALFGMTVANRKRWFTSYSITIEILSPSNATRFLFVPRLDAGAERLVTWEDTLHRRGVHRLAGVKLTTRFPFGLFLKAGRPMLTSEVVVYPAVLPVSPELLRQLGTAGDRRARRRGRGTSFTGGAAPRRRPSWSASWRPRRRKIRGWCWSAPERAMPPPSRRACQRPHRWRPT